jgi:C-terminal processing protease CtpA/Prc
LAPSRDEQQAFGTNKGLIVASVRRESSSYDAEVLPGDLLLKIDGQTIDGGPASLRPTFAAAAGGEVTLTIRRKTGEVTKRVVVRR